MGHVVGFLGDGVNDAPAMHAADTSLSVEQAVDVAREAADFVLLERGLDVNRRGSEEGRRTFANTRKDVHGGGSFRAVPIVKFFTTTAENFARIIGQTDAIRLNVAKTAACASGTPLAAAVLGS